MNKMLGDSENLQVKIYIISSLLIDILKEIGNHEYIPD